MYEDQVQIRLFHWKQEVLKKDSILQRTSKRIQTKIQERIPEKVHQTITTAVKGMMISVATGSKWLSPRNINQQLTLKEREEKAYELLSIYKKSAAAEGAITGAGGLLLGLADFPLLLSIKIKFLYDLAAIYGFNVQLREERIYILYLFQLAFSSASHKQNVFPIVTNWQSHKQEAMTIDWETLQIEYRDYIDFIKLLQLVPIIGAPVGAYANYSLLDTLGETAMNAYAWRFLHEKS